MKTVLKDQPRASKKVEAKIAHHKITATKTFQPIQDKPAGNRKSAFTGHRSGKSPDQTKQQSLKATLKGGAKGNNKVEHCKLADKYGTAPKSTIVPKDHTASHTGVGHAKMEFYKNHPAQQMYGTMNRKSSANGEMK